jgi:peroxiredoxin
MRFFDGMLAAVLAASLTVPALALTAGQPAPDVGAKGADGKTYKLADFKGKYVVLEWHNAGCPYVKKHYEPGNMQKLQKQWTAKGVVWLKVLSSAHGKQGSVTAAQEIKYNKENGVAATASLMDDDQVVAKAFGAKVTPHMFVLDPKGNIIYSGAIDDKSGADPKEVETAKNYVSQALEESMAGKKVSVTTSKPYGCGVKYK